MTYKVLADRGSTVQDWNGFEYTGELIEFKNDRGETCVYRVIKGKFTPYGSIRDCGDHYIKANHSSYSRIEKSTMRVTGDVEDR